MINIAGLDKAKILAALAGGTAPRGLGWLHAGPGSDNEQAARETLARTTYVDYFAGRPIKVDFSGDEIDPRLYDRDAGDGAAERVIATLRG